MNEKPMEIVCWFCHQCGASGEVPCSDDTPFRRVTMDVENAHAATAPECPWNRERITLSVLV